LTARDPRAKAITSNRERLSTTIQADFTGVSLATALMTIGDSIDAPIWIHEQELDALGIDSDVPIRLSIGRELTAQTALDLILKPLDLSYRVGEVIEVTSIDALNAEPDLRLYDLSYILPNSSNSDAMLNAIQQSIDADNWLAAGGESCITLVGSMMVVSAPYTTQCEIEQFLAKFMRMNPENARQSPASSTPMYGMGGGMGGMGGGMGMGMGGGMF
jgi:hypothetical protein